MAEIINGEFKFIEENKNSFGGTERLTQKLVEIIPQEILKEFQIISSSVRSELDESKIRIFWAHDLPTDTSSAFLSDKATHESFHKFVFVSNWQMQAYMNTFNLPWSKCCVMKNAIDPFTEECVKPDPKEELRLIYTSTPQRGLHILVPAVAHLAKQYPHIHLDVFSSFKIYGRDDDDAAYTELYQQIEEHPNMTYHGFQPNDVVREHVAKAHMFVYPSIWAETSCMSLMEAMAAGCICVHSNYGALFETAANWTQMYQTNENVNQHAGTLVKLCETMIENINDEGIQSRLPAQSNYANIFYGWPARRYEWEGLLRNLINAYPPEERSIPVFEEMFEINTG